MGRKAASICVCVCNLCLCVMIAPLQCLQFNIVEPHPRNSVLKLQRGRITRLLLTAIPVVCVYAPQCRLDGLKISSILSF